MLVRARTIAIQHREWSAIGEPVPECGVGTLEHAETTTRHGDVHSASVCMLYNTKGHSYRSDRPAISNHTAMQQYTMPTRSLHVLQHLVPAKGTARLTNRPLRATPRVSASRVRTRARWGLISDLGLGTVRRDCTGRAPKPEGL